MREQSVGRAELARRLRWHLPQVNRVLDLATPHGWNTWKPRSLRSACG
jgi:hypothetical protein